MQIKLAVFACLLSFLAVAQQVKRVSKLSPELHEISGLITYDSLFIAINDGGNEPDLFFLNHQGNIVHRVRISNAQNVDWEDITKDNKGTIYISDLGNNLNKRTDLCIYVVASDSLLFKKEVLAEKITINYAEQKSFPPTKDSMHFDVEAMTYFKDSLYLFTKSKTEPFDGISYVYKFPTKIGNYTLQRFQTLQLKKRKEILDAVTAVTVNNNLFYILTYSGIELFEINSTGKLNYQKRIGFKMLSQKEAISTDSKMLYLADEKRGKLGGKFYNLKLNSSD